MKQDSAPKTTKRILGRKLAREIPEQELEKVAGGVETISLANGHPNDVGEDEEFQRV
ncbi:MAG: hypothetical protein GY719_36570 [bacterium]|nr:hypothetical protein [bacterium]